MKVEITATTLDQFQKANDILKRIGGDVEKKVGAARVNDFGTTLYIRAHMLSNVLELPVTVDIHEVEMQDVGEGKFVYRINLIMNDELAKAQNSAFPTFVELRILEMTGVNLKIVRKRI